MAKLSQIRVTVKVNGLYIKPSKEIIVESEFFLNKNVLKIRKCLTLLMAESLTFWKDSFSS